MKVHLDCIPCFQRQALQAARFVTDDESKQEEILRETREFENKEVDDFTDEDLASVEQVQDNVEAVACQQLFILFRLEAGMEQRMAVDITDCGPRAGAGCKQQQSVRGDVLLEDREHPALIVCAEMEAAVPRQDRVEAAAERERAHILGYPGRILPSVPEPPKRPCARHPADRVGAEEAPPAET